MTVQFTKGTFNAAFRQGDKLNEVSKEGYKLALHGLDFGIYKEGSSWTLIEIESGMKATSGKTRQAAIDELERTIKARSLDWFKSLIESAVKTNKELKKKGAKVSEVLAEQQKEADALKGRDEAFRYAEQHKIRENYIAILTLEISMSHKIDNTDAYKEAYKKELELFLTMATKQAIDKAKVKAEAEKAEAEAKAQAEAKMNAEKEKAEEPKQEEKPKKKWNIGIFFKGVATLEDLKKAYRKFSKWLHPDVSEYENANEAFKAMKEQYEKAETLIKAGKVNDETNNNNPELDKALAEMVAKINHLEGIEIKIRGSWIWVAGVDRTDKAKQEVLKANGFRFGAKALEWYYAVETAGQKKRRGRGYTAEDLKDKFGETIIRTTGKPKLEQ